MRSGFRRAPGLAAVALCAQLLALSGGCRSGSEHDLVLRELRMQEDQLYAMEDYLNQYQGLLRQARAENRELKNRLATESNELPMPNSPRRAPAEPPAESPSTPAPTTPDTPSTPQPGPVEMPDVPGLDETISLPEGEEPATLSWGGTGGESAVMAAAWSAEEDGEAGSVSSSEGRLATAPAERIELEGEIVATDPSATRLIVDVVPTTANRSPGSLAGSLSLMILAIEEGSDPTSLARWDFGAPELVEIADQSPEGRLRFYLELPGEAPEGRVQIWGRFLPEAGPKMLASADFQLDLVGHFSSAGVSAVTAADAVEPGEPKRDTAIMEAAEDSPGVRERFIDVADGTWAVATPGQRPSETTDGSADWQRSTERLPQRAPRVSASPAARLEGLAREADEERLPAPQGHASPRYALPTWSPERAGPKNRLPQAQETAVSGPTWSPER